MEWENWSILIKPPAPTISRHTTKNFIARTKFSASSLSKLKKFLRMAIIWTQCYQQGQTFKTFGLFGSSASENIMLSFEL